MFYPGRPVAASGAKSSDGRRWGARSTSGPGGALVRVDQQLKTLSQAVVIRAACNGARKVRLELSGLQAAEDGQAELDAMTVPRTTRSMV